MARFNEILSGRFNRALQKMTSIKGGPPTPQLASEIMPVLPMFYGREHRWLESWNLFGLAVQQAAVVGNPSAIRLRNPAGSNIIAVVELIYLVINVADTVQIGITVSGVLNDLTTVIGSGVVLDNRGGNIGSNVIASKQGAVAGLGTIILQPALLANTTISLLSGNDQQIVLAPNTTLTFLSFNNNEILTASFLWRERFLEDSERQ